MVTTNYDIRVDRKFCTQCGSPMRVLKEVQRYDPRTGEPIEILHWQCTNYGLVSPFTIFRHDRLTPTQGQL